GRLEEAESRERGRVIDVQLLGEREEQGDRSPDGEAEMDSRTLSLPRAREPEQEDERRKEESRPQLAERQTDAVGQERPGFVDSGEPVLRIRDVAARSRSFARLPRDIPDPAGEPEPQAAREGQDRQAPGPERG